MRWLGNLYVTAVAASGKALVRLKHYDQASISLSSDRFEATTTYDYITATETGVGCIINETAERFE
jgi:hypothetical protein